MEKGKWVQISQGEVSFPCKKDIFLQLARTVTHQSKISRDVIDTPSLEVFEM